MAESANILVVEDEAPIRMVWERFLQRWGYAPTLAANGKEALDLTRERDFQMVITDLTMPVMTGQELVHNLKQECPHLEILVTTGQGTIEVAVEMMKAGAYDFITKPINFTSAEYLIKKCLEKVDTHAENVRLRRINKDLEELNKIKQKFIAITSHELRTPVSVISNVLEVVSPQFAGTEEEHLYRMLSSSAKHLSEIVNEMHEISQISSERMALQPSQFQIARICEEIQEELAYVLAQCQQTLGWKVSNEISVWADRVKLKKVVRELVQNAIKFTQDGGTIDVLARMNDRGEFELTVSDNGMGIPPEEREKIFHLFYEVGDELHHHTSKESYQGGGMGIGLSIVSDIVEAHQGRIEVDSTVKKGSHFTVTIPQPSAGVALN